MTTAMHVQQIGRALRPSAWHLQQSDPCDETDPKTRMGWKWLEPDNDPCDDWPYISVGGQVAFIAGFDFSYSDRVNLNAAYGKFGGRDIDFIVIDECHHIPVKTYRLGGKTAELRDRLTAAAEALELVKGEAPLPHYDYQRHNKVRKRRP